VTDVWLSIRWPDQRGIENRLVPEQSAQELAQQARKEGGDPLILPRAWMGK
jgi:hypothetical protein